MIMQDEPSNKGGYLGQGNLTGSAEPCSEISCETTLAGMRLPTMSQVQYFLLSTVKANRQWIVCLEDGPGQRDDFRNLREYRIIVSVDQGLPIKYRQ
jgi:hypothetical protein